MSDSLYVQNESSLQLPKLIEKSDRGLDDLMPGEVGRVPPEVAKQPRVQSWIEQGRLKIISDDEFNKYFDQATHEEENVSFKAKVTVKKEEDTTVVVPGLDDLPEIDDIPEPAVSNLDGVVTVKAPDDDEPLTERAGDPIEVDPTELNTKRLKDDGTLEDMADGPAEDLEKDSEKPDPPKTAKLPDFEPASVEEPPAEEEASAEETPKVSEEAPESVSEDEPLVDMPTATTDVVQSILKDSAWRRQVKAIKACDDADVILAVAEQTSRNVVKKACTERLEELT